MENQRQSIELADIFSSHANTYLQQHKLCPNQIKAFTAIMQCRTGALGGHAEHCDQCGYVRQAYNSCRNRHCPKCQYVKKAQWVDKLAGNLPPVKYFHIVFTIPHCLNSLFYLNQKNAYDLLFKASGQALLQCAANPAFLGVQAGAVSLLHTWGQTLIYHPHIHMIVPAGGLSGDMMEWLAAGKKFFLPVRALSMVFRGILCRLLEQAVINGTIKLTDDCPGFKSLKEQCYLKQWVVYCERPFSGPENLINYLGNYTHRVAISNQRIISHADDQVSFSYKDNKDGGMRKNMTLSANEFIGRFMQHILPDGFCKIRYFGFMAMRNMSTKLSLCFDYIKNAAYLPVLAGLTALEVWREITGRDPICCPECKTGRMVAFVRQDVNQARTG